MQLSGLTTPYLWLVFIVAALVIAFAGTRLSALADRIADRTGLGESLVGAVLLGGSTSMSGIVTSLTAAAGGHAELAVANAIGGIAAQTLFLAIADIAYRKANLEHAAASLGNLVQTTLLLSLLALPLLAAAGPQIALAGVHPASLLLIVGYVAGVRLAASSQEASMWGARTTAKTVLDEPDPHDDGTPSTRVLAVQFGLFALLLAVPGFVIALTGAEIAARTGLTESLVGALFTAVATSLPELFTTLAAVRQGALTLAVSGIVGGNAFDVLFLAGADLAFRDGSIYHAMSSRESGLLALAQLMTGVLLLGLLRRERSGLANIGFESALLFLLYFGGMVVLTFGA